MKQFLLALVLVAVPVMLFSGFQATFFGSRDAAPVTMGDLSNLKLIAADMQGLAKSGDIETARKRVTDFETAWDTAESVLRPLNAAAWGKVDAAADSAIRALRAEAPEASAVVGATAGLVAALDDPYSGRGGLGDIQRVAGIAVTDASGHSLACEDMIAEVRDAVDGGKIAETDLAVARDFQTKATERCNADDDAHADAYSARALALQSH